MLFIDFEQPNRVRVSGQATLSDDPALVGRYPGAQFAVHVAVDDVFPNCPRYIHRTASHELSPERPRRRRRGADRRVEVHAGVHRRPRRRRPRPRGVSRRAPASERRRRRRRDAHSRAGRSWPSARPSSSAPARPATTRRTDADATTAPTASPPDTTTARRSTDATRGDHDDARTDDRPARRRPVPARRVVGRPRRHVGRAVDPPRRRPCPTPST